MSNTHMGTNGIAAVSVPGIEQDATRADGEGVVRLAGIHGETRIETEIGPLPVRHLRPGDKVRLAGGGTATLRGIKRLGFEAELMAAQPRLRPIRIAARCFGAGLPLRDVVVAPQQTVGTDARETRAPFVEAEACIGREGFTRPAAEETSYYLLDLGGPAVIQSEGLALRIDAPAAATD